MKSHNKIKTSPRNCWGK